MKYITVIFTIVFISIAYIQCGTNKSLGESVEYTSSIKHENGQDLTIELIAGESFNHPSYVIWIEDMSGSYIETLFITNSYASGVFGHEMVGDSIWLPNPGASYQPSALPYWTYKKGLINGKGLIPTPENPYTDGYSGATPKGNLTFNTGTSKELPVRILCEINQPWDWDKHWTNNKFPGNKAYEHSAQPSIIYSVSLNNESDTFYLNPIGHGDPTGESGKLFTNLSTLSSAKKIFNSISINLNT